MLLASLPALAHGTLYATDGLVASPDGAEVWALAGGWGLIHSADGGASWTWMCEESLGDVPIVAVETLDGSAIAIGGQGALVRREGGESTAYSGLPADVQVGSLRRFGDQLLVDVSSDLEADGLWTCAGLACSATDLAQDGSFVQSIRVDDQAWVVLRTSDTLRSTLWRSADGDTWTQVADWGDGGPTRTMLHADGDTLWFWAQPRDPEADPWLERSVDGGVTVTTVWDGGYGTTDLPGLARIDGAWLLSNALGYTFRSDDDGATWTDVTETMPMIRCALEVGDEVWVCTDHFVDGFDVARLDAPDAWTALGCMDHADVGDDACADFVDAFVEAGAYGGDACDARYAPGEETEGCGCGGDADAVAMIGLLALWRRRRRVA